MNVWIVGLVPGHAYSVLEVKGDHVPNLSS